MLDKKYSDSDTFVGKNSIPSRDLPEQAAAVRHKFPEQYPNLTALNECLVESPQVLICRSVEPEQLEMLEAELRNQGILPKPEGEAQLISFRVMREIASLKWRARSIGLDKVNLHFAIDLPRYVNARAIQLHQTTSVKSTSDSIRIDPLIDGSSLSSYSNESEMLFLERFAMFLTGEFERSANRYQRGLNVILRVLTRSNKERSTSRFRAGNRGSKTSILLPISKREFTKQISAIALTALPLNAVYES